MGYAVWKRCSLCYMGLYKSKVLGDIRSDGCKFYSLPPNKSHTGSFVMLTWTAIANCEMSNTVINQRSNKQQLPGTM